jgi:Ca-activated chloride channel homolog
MFRFVHSEYLHALYAIPVCIVLFWLYQKNQKRLLSKFSNWKLRSVVFEDKSSYKPFIKFGILMLVFALLIMALANPQIGTRVEEVKQKGIDVYILLDVSLSMKAEDIKPNRLEKAKNEISNLIRKLKGDRMGLVVFSGDAYIQFPLTTDYSAANLFLSAADEKTVPEAGTAIAAAINLAAKSFDYTATTKKVIVVITDGEDHEGDVTSAVKDAVGKGVMLYAIGLGSPDGVPIPIYNGNQPAGYKTDKDGKTVLTKLDESILKEIATNGNGKYYRGSNYDDELDLIYKDLSSIEKNEYGSQRVTNYESRFYYFLFPAVFLLIIEFFIPEKKSRLFTKLARKLKIDKNV